MTIKALEGLTPDWFTPDSEKDSETPTRFLLKPLNGFEYMDVLGEMRTDEQGNRSMTPRGLRLAIQHGLVGWENYAVPFSREAMPTVPVVHLAEIAQEIIDRSDLTGEKAKN